MCVECYLNGHFDTNVMSAKNYKDPILYKATLKLDSLKNDKEYLTKQIEKEKRFTEKNIQVLSDISKNLIMKIVTN